MKNSKLLGICGVKNAGAAALAAVLTGLAVLTAAPAAWAQSTLEKVKSRSQLVVGYRDNGSPFSFAPNGVPMGYSIDLCAPIIERIRQATGAKNLRVVYQVVEPERAVQLLKSGAVDLMCSNMSDTPDRRKAIAFSPPIYYAALRVLVRSQAKLTSVDQLAGKNLVTIGGSTAPVLLDAYAASRGLNWQTSRVLEHEAAMSQLALGQAAGYARDGVLLLSALQTVKNPADFTLLPERLSSEPIAMAYRQGDPSMQKLVDVSIVESMRSGLLKQSYDKWFTQPIVPTNKAINMPMSPELAALLAAAK